MTEFSRVMEVNIHEEKPLLSRLLHGKLGTSRGEFVVPAVNNALPDDISVADSVERLVETQLWRGWCRGLKNRPAQRPV